MYPTSPTSCRRGVCRSRPPTSRPGRSRASPTRRPQLAAFLQSRGMPTDVGAIARERVEAFLVHLRDTRSAYDPRDPLPRAQAVLRVARGRGRDHSLADLSDAPTEGLRAARGRAELGGPAGTLTAVCTTNDYDGRRDTAIVRLREGRQAGTRAMRLPAGHRRPVKDGAATRSISSSQGRADPRSGSSRSLRCDESEHQEPQYDQSRKCVRDIARSRHAAPRSRRLPAPTVPTVGVEAPADDGLEGSGRR